MHHISYSCLLITVTLLIAACGKKHKNVFLFQQNAVKLPNRLAMPSVRGVRVRSCRQEVHISWHHVDKKLVADFDIIGYNVYRLTTWGVVPKQPLNVVPCSKNWFVDTDYRAKSQRSYLVKVVGKNQLVALEGPASNIVSVEN